jgi:WD40 repeat protein
MNSRFDSPTACMTLLIILGVLRSALVFAQTTDSPAANETDEKKVVNYEAVQPILRKHCVSCHNDDQSRGGLSLVSLEKILAGSSSGHVMTAGKPEESLLYLVTAHLDNPKMPPNKPRIPQRELDLLEKWMRTGLVEETKAANDESDPPKQPTMPVGKNESTGLSEKVIPLPQRGPIHAMAVHPIEPDIAIPGVGQILLLDALSKRPAKAISLPNQTVSDLQYSPSGDVLYVATGVPGEWGHVARWDVAKNAWLEPMGKESDTPYCLAISHDGKQLAVGTTAKVVKVYSIVDGQARFTFEKHTDWITSLNWSPDGLLLASGDRFGAIQLWDMTKGTSFATLRGHTGAIVGFLWTADGNHLVSGAWDGFLSTWDLHTQAQTLTWKAHEKGTLGLVGFDRSGTLEKQGSWLSFGRDGRLSRWTLAPEDAAPGIAMIPSATLKLPDEITQVALVPRTPSGFDSSLLNVDPSLFVVCEATGKVDLVAWDKSKSMLSGFRGIEVPLEPSVQPFQVRKPIPPLRMASAVKKSDLETPTKDGAPKGLSSEQRTLKADLSSSHASPSHSSHAGPIPSKKSLQDDLADSQRALESIEQSQVKTREVLSQLEESAARLKQLIAIQEARLKQWDINETKGAKTP